MASGGGSTITPPRPNSLLSTPFSRKLLFETRSPFTEKPSLARSFSNTPPLTFEPVWPEFAPRTEVRELDEISAVQWQFGNSSFRLLCTKGGRFGLQQWSCSRYLYRFG